MPSSNISSPSKKTTKLLFLISLLVCLVLSLPVATPPNNAFYNIDPDIPYLANGLSLTAVNQVSFTNHPGTPLIQFLSLSHIPLRALSKIAKRPFIPLALENYSYLVWYHRLIMFFLFTFSLFCLTCIWRKISMSIPAVITGIGLTLLYSSIVALPTGIWAESFLFALFPLWLLTYYLATIHPTSTRLLLLGSITGVMLATKFTSLSLIIASIIVILFEKDSQKKLTAKLISLCIFSLSTIEGFIVGTWPIVTKYPILFSWTKTLVSHANLYGKGATSVIDPALYFRSLSAIVDNNQMMLLVTFTCILVLFLINAQKSLRWKALGIASLTGFAVLVKFQMDYYQIINYMGLITVSVFVISRLRVKQQYILLAFISAYSLTGLIPKEQIMRKQVNESVKLASFIKSRPQAGIIVWEWARSKEFALLWSKHWSGESLTPRINSLFPNLYSLDSLDTISGTSGKHPVMDICWNTLYIQKVSYPEFIKENPQAKNLPSEEIPDTSILMVKNPQCTPTSP